MTATRAQYFDARVPFATIAWEARCHPIWYFESVSGSFLGVDPPVQRGQFWRCRTCLTLHEGDERILFSHLRAHAHSGEVIVREHTARGAQGYRVQRHYFRCTPA